MERKLGLLSLAFFLLLGVGAYLWLFGKPASPNSSPFKKIDFKKTSALTIKNNYGVARLEKKKDGWHLMDPVEDVADPVNIQEIIDTLSSFTLGSVISENPARYSEFNVDAAQGVEVNVFVDNADKPALSGIVGKDTGQYHNAYFRFNVSSGPVYIGNGLVQAFFHRAPYGFRLLNVMSFPKEDKPTRVRFTTGKQSWDMSRSSNTWTNVAGHVVDIGAAEDLIFNLRGYRAEGIDLTTPSPADLGFDPPAKPFMQLIVDVDATSYVFTIGKPVTKNNPQLYPSRYGRASNRPGIFILQEGNLKQFEAWFSKLPN